MKLPETFDLNFYPLTTDDRDLRDAFADHLGAATWCALRAGRLVDDQFNSTVTQVIDELRALKDKALLNPANVLRCLRRRREGIFGSSEDLNEVTQTIFPLLVGRIPLVITTPSGRFLTNRRMLLDGVLDLNLAKCVAVDCDCIAGHCLPRLVGVADTPAASANIAIVEELLKHLNGRYVRVFVEFESGPSKPVEIIG